MKFSRICIIVLFIVVVSCKHKKVIHSGEDVTDVKDFIEFFQPVSLPYGFADSTLQKKDKDSLLISYKIFSQFIPDSLLSKMFGKNIKLKMYPMGKVSIPGAENYLFAKVVASDKKVAFVFCFDKEQNFVAGMPVLRPDQYASTMQTVTIDKKYTIFKSLLRKNSDGSFSDGRDVYILNSDAKSFMLIMTDPLEDKVTEIINPIDTLPRKNKFSADYSNGKMNLVSIRDGRKNDRLTFFIHFEKNNGECIGDLKGEAMIKGLNAAEFRENGESCALLFTFSSSSVSLKEIEACGAHRGLRCLYDGSYARKKNKKVSLKK